MKLSLFSPSGKATLHPMQQQADQLLLIESNMVSSEMECSSEVVQGTQGCNSSTESGWTMYLNSPTQTDASDQDDESFALDRENRQEGLDDEDDSMASDASSGPNRRNMADYNSPKRHSNGAPASPKKYHKQSVKKGIRREQRFRSQDDNKSQELVSSAATEFSRILGHGRTKVRKYKQG